MSLEPDEIGTQTPRREPTRGRRGRRPPAAQARGLRRNQPCDASALAFQPPELREDGCLWPPPPICRLCLAAPAARRLLSGKKSLRRTAPFEERTRDTQLLTQELTRAPPPVSPCSPRGAALTVHSACSETDRPGRGLCSARLRRGPLLPLLPPLPSPSPSSPLPPPSLHPSAILHSSASKGRWAMEYFQALREQDPGRPTCLPGAAPGLPGPAAQLRGRCDSLFLVTGFGRSCASGAGVGC